MKLKISTLMLLSAATLLSAKIKVACVGDSITFGSGIPNREKLSYPAQLGALLGDAYEVRNFGVSGATMLENGDNPYIKTHAYKPSLDYQPDIVIIKLGTNDSKPHNWKHKANYSKDAESLIASYKKLTSGNGKRPRVILCKPAPVLGAQWGITEKVTRGEIAKLLDNVAISQQTEIIDLHIPLRDKPEFIPDKVHPNAFGAERMARHIHRNLTISRSPGFQLKKSWRGATGNFHGYTMLDWSVPDKENKKKTINFKVVKPYIAAKGNPWIWRARFWGHQPQLDIQLLELGYHVCYCDVADLFGSPAAVARWDAFYKQTQEWGLNAKPVLEGMSRGGLIIHNWAAANPDKVAGIIGDNCVMDFKSWPGGHGTGKGSPPTWNKCKAAYGFENEEQAKTYLQNPIDHLKTIKQANIPIMYLIGSADDVVPPAENSALAAEKLKPYPQLTVIDKPGQGHHPHSLPNPAPITDFALKCYGLYINPAALPSPSAEYRGGSAGWGGGIWYDQHSNINKIAKENQDLKLIFLGDSITQSWTGPHHRLSNKNGKRPFDVHFGQDGKSASFGISGDRTEHLLYRIQNGNFEGLKPETIVLMIGVNNASTGHNAAQITSGIEAICTALQKKLPTTKIILLGPFPAGHDPNSPLRATLDGVHRNLTELKSSSNVTYKNISEAFLNEDKTLNKTFYSGDGIHLNGNGYQQWEKQLQPILQAPTR